MRRHGRRIRGRPPSTSSTRRRYRATHNAAARPAGPPPITATSTAASSSATRCLLYACTTISAVRRCQDSSMSTTTRLRTSSWSPPTMIRQVGAQIVEHVDHLRAVCTRNTGNRIPLRLRSPRSVFKFARSGEGRTFGPGRCGKSVVEEAPKVLLLPGSNSGTATFQQGSHGPVRRPPSRRDVHPEWPDVGVADRTTATRCAERDHDLAFSEHHVRDDQTSVNGLIRRIQDDDDQRALGALMAEFDWVAVQCARRMYRRGESIEDLEQVAREGPRGLSRVSTWIEGWRSRRSPGPPYGCPSPSLSQPLAGACPAACRLAGIASGHDASHRAPERRRRTGADRR